MLSDTTPPLNAMAIRPPRIETVPVYPVLLFVAWIVALFTETADSLQVLARPLIVGALIAAVLQLGLSGVTRNRHLGAILVTILGMALLGWAHVALFAVVLLLAAVGLAAIQHRSVASLPWSLLTRVLNVISAITVALVIGTGGLSGALTPIQTRPFSAGAVPNPLPDIYLVLLDAYPRSDTLASDFGFDNEPFLGEMRSMGFEEAAHSHSNYNLTALTLASMFNMSQVSNLPSIGESNSVASEFRALAGAINRGSAFDALEDAGYEMLTIPSAYSFVTAYAVNRVLDGGQLTDFEYAVLEQGSLRRLAPDRLGPWLINQERARTTGAFETLGELASQRHDHPRFVFAHVGSPHPPVVFGSQGEVRNAWPCFPVQCGIFYGGDIYGDAVKGPIADQIAYLNGVVATTARTILAASERPPIIVFFSDHGSRFDPDYKDETLRSFLIAFTPGHAGLFPSDVTPVNLIPRILNAYAGAGLPLASEESYWVNLRRTSAHDPPFDLIPWVVRDP